MASCPILPNPYPSQVQLCGPVIDVVTPLLLVSVGARDHTTVAAPLVVLKSTKARESRDHPLLSLKFDVCTHSPVSSFDGRFIQTSGTVAQVRAQHFITTSVCECTIIDYSRMMHQHQWSGDMGLPFCWCWCAVVDISPWSQPLQ